MKTPSIVRTVYLYLFSLIGLCLAVIGGVRLADMGLRAFVFTKADDMERVASMPSYPPFSEKDISLIAEKKELSEEERLALSRWLADYEKWQKAEADRDYVGARRSREASESIAFILIGLPLYFYHWSVVRRESVKKED